MSSLSKYLFGRSFFSSAVQHFFASTESWGVVSGLCGVVFLLLLFVLGFLCVLFFFPSFSFNFFFWYCIVGVGFDLFTCVLQISHKLAMQSS